MKEKSVKTLSGFLVLFIHLALLAVLILTVVLLATGQIGETSSAALMISGSLLMAFTLPGYFIIQPNESKVLVLFGKYAGSVREDGFFWSNPFFSKRRISLRARNLTTEKIKV
ncbi:MAG: SPFH domain-containing protein, partial [Bacteroidetes bacterium]|nr:SPFH domain-containing protein [Bacteroidota bacterium]